MFDLVIKQRNTTPLCFMPDDRLVCYHRGRILFVQDGVIERSFIIPIGTRECCLGWNKMMSRLMRFGIRASVALDNEHVLFSISNVIYELDIPKLKISKGWYCGDGIRPLFLSEVKGINGFKDGIYFGQYMGNRHLNPVSIFYRDGVDDWKLVYTFPKGTIKHIHNIIPDPFRQCLWIMTGDFGEAAALWKAIDGFKKVEHVAGGNQRWRGCVGFAIPEGLIFATDTPFSDNHVYLIKDDGVLENVIDISGSCIYGCHWKDKYVFSTVVEPDGRNESFLRLLFGWKRGSGIRDKYVHVYCGNLQSGFSEIYKEEKDYLPFLFQFGALKFPTGLNDSDVLYFQPMATRKNDLNLIGIKLINEK